MKILILGAAGQIGRMLAKDLIEQTENDLVLYARNASNRLKGLTSERVSLVNGDFSDYVHLVNAMKGVETIIKAMKAVGIKRIIAASILGIYDEVPGAFGDWNRHMVGDKGIQLHKETVALVETPELDYTILRLTWLYNQPGNCKYHLTKKNEPFQGVQVTRQAVSQLIVDILKDHKGQFIKSSLGVSEPDTNWDKPSFY